MIKGLCAFLTVIKSLCVCVTVIKGLCVCLTVIKGLCVCLTAIKGESRERGWSLGCGSLNSSKGVCVSL